MYYILIILGTLLCSAFFSGVEIAFLSSNKLKIELENKQGYFSAGILARFVKFPTRFIGTMLVGNSISLVIYGIFMGGILEPFIKKFLSSETAIIITQTFFSTLLILITAEFMPKALFRINPNQTLNFFAVPVLISYYVLYPIVYVITGISEVLLKKVFKLNFMENKPVFGRIDLDHYIRDIASKHREGDINAEIQIFQKALDFTGVKVRECMVPRTEIVAMSVKSSVDDLRKNFIRSGLSKILIYKDAVDNIIGFVHCREIFRRPADIESVLLPVSIVPETMPANELLTQFTSRHRSLAVVVDEFGVTSGIVTIEDVMEEIFGEIDDEFDTDNFIEKQSGENEYVFSGRLEVDFINHKYHLGIPVNDSYETLAGFIFHNHENIPEKNEEIVIPPYRFTILEVSETRIDRVRMKVEK